MDRLPLVKQVLINIHAAYIQQQASVLRDEIGEDVIEIHGGNSSSAKILLENGDIIVVIADVLFRMLNDGITTMRDYWY